jgi:hypothetical protein
MELLDLVGRDDVLDPVWERWLWIAVNLQAKMAP